MGNLCTKRPVNKPYSNIQKDDLIYNHLNTNQFHSKSNYQSGVETKKQKCHPNYHKEYNFKMKYQEYYKNKKAKNNNDLNTLVANMENDQLPVNDIQMGHPWAQNPKTIGSIATMYISILFMRYLVKDEEGYEQQEEKIQQTLEEFLNLNGIDKIIKNLKHKDEDRVQIKLSDFIPYLLNDDIFVSIMPFFYDNEKNSIGLKIASGYILREIYKNKNQNAINSLLNLFDHENSQNIIEGLSNLDDLCNEQQNNQMPKISVVTCKQLYDLGFYAKLEKCKNRLYQLNSQSNTEHDESQQEIIDQRCITIQLIDCLMNKLLQNSQKV